MKIVVVSDSHGRNDILNAIREKHPDAGLFIHCGDLEDDPMLRIRIVSRIFQEANSFQIGQKHWIVILYVLGIRTLPIWIK